MFKLIVSKTIMFVAIVGFISLFKMVFGTENSLIGVTTLCLLLALLQRDLTVNWVSKLFAMIGLNLVFGLCAILAHQNVWLGLVMNFTVMFLIGYVFNYELRRPLNMLVGLHYVLMLANRITVEQVPSRIIALIAGPIIIILVQLILNKNKWKMHAKKIITTIEQQLVNKIDCILEKKDCQDINLAVESQLQQLKLITHDRTLNDQQLNQNEQRVITWLACLEKINSLINVSLSEQELSEIKTILNTSSMSETCLQNQIELHLTLKLWLQQKNNDCKTQVQRVPSHHSETHDNTVFKRMLNLKSLRVKFGIRLGLLVGITCFFTDYYQLEFGNWLMYTVFALTQPYIEFTVTKSKQRLQGTIVGSIIIFILFNLIEDHNTRLLLLLSAGYLMSYMVDYRNVMIFVTLSSISAAGLDMVNPNEVILNRLIFVVFGVGLAVIINKFVLVGTYEEEHSALQKLEKNMFEYMFGVIMSKRKEKKTPMAYLYLIPTLIDDKITLSKLNVTIEQRRGYQKLINDLYVIYLLSMNNQVVYNALATIREEYKLKGVISSQETTSSIGHFVSSEMKKYKEIVETF